MTTFIPGSPTAKRRRAAMQAALYTARHNRLARVAAASAKPASGWDSTTTTEVTLSTDKFTASSIAGFNGGLKGTQSHSSGKFYIEFVAKTPQNNNLDAGLATTSCIAIEGQNDNSKLAVINNNGNGIANNFGFFGGLRGGTGGLVDGDVLRFAVDLSNGLLWFTINANSWNANGSADPGTGVGGINISTTLVGAIYPYLIAQGGFTAGPTSGARIITGNGFNYSPPSGFSAWG